MTFPPNVLHSRNLRFGIATVAALGLLVAIPVSAQAATAPVPLGTADSYVVLAGAGITNTGSTTLNGNVGTSPAASITGFNTVTLSGAKHAADAQAAQAQLDLGTAFGTAGAAGPTKAIPVELGNKRLKPGVYTGGALQITGTLTLDGTGNPDGVFIFKATSTLITASNSHITLINVNPCNVFWRVESSATLGSGSQFVGTVMAAQSAQLNAGATVSGRVLAQSKSVTLLANTITKPACKAVTTAASSNATPTPTPSPSPSPSPQVSVAPSGAVRTGDGSTSGGDNTPGLLTGALILAGAGGVTFVAARRRRLNS